jgi:hypothetical protein
MNPSSQAILASHKSLLSGLPQERRAEEAAEGGCGVLGFAANLPVTERHVLVDGAG